MSVDHPDRSGAAEALEAPLTSAAADPRDRGLLRMKRIALGLLLLAAAVYVVATRQAGAPEASPAWGYVAAFAEAAMVGAVADWFAIVALFRRPLGLPIPHTAIVPRNKARIGRNLADFIVRHFLAPGPLVERLQRMDVASRLGRWLAEPAQAERIGAHLVGAVRELLPTLDDERVARFLERSAQAGLERVELAPMAGRWLDLLLHERRHQALLDELLVQVARLLENEETQAHITDAIAAEVRGLRYLGLDNVAARLATGKIVGATVRTIGEMGADAEHPLRLRFDGFMLEFIERLKSDPAFLARGDVVRDELLDHPALRQTLQGLWDGLRHWLHEDLGRNDSLLRARLVRATAGLGAQLAREPALRDGLNAQIAAVVPVWIERHRETIREHIVGRIEAWDAEAMTAEIERHVGRDLQFIRVNGTVVGGLVGLAIHALTQALR